MSYPPRVFNTFAAQSATRPSQIHIHRLQMLLPIKSPHPRATHVVSTDAYHRHLYVSVFCSRKRYSTIPTYYEHPVFLLFLGYSPFPLPYDLTGAGVRIITFQVHSFTHDMKRSYNARHRPEVFKPDDNVWLSSKDLMTKRPSKKLDYKRLGPLRIIRKVSELAYELKLPQAFKIYPVISASRLELDEWQRPRPRVPVAKSHSRVKIRDPHTGDIIDSVENRRSLLKKIWPKYFFICEENESNEDVRFDRRGQWCDVL
jgi:hypothetical protein